MAPAKMEQAAVFIAPGPCKPLGMLLVAAMLVRPFLKMDVCCYGGFRVNFVPQLVAGFCKR